MTLASILPSESKHGSLSVRRTASARRAKQARRTGGVPPAPKRKKSSRTDAGAAALFVLPSFAGVCVFVLLPFLDTVRRSFTNALGTKSVGAANYTSVLSNDAFRLAAYNTARFLAVCIPLLLCVSLALALLVRAVKGGGRIFKTTYLLPMAVPVASVVVLWQALFGTRGILNGALVFLGGAPIDFMGTDAAFWVLIVTYLWKNSGYDMILWLAGLDGIPAALYEAAAVDGAGKWKMFRCITLPSLLPTLGLTAVLSLLNMFKVFREAYLVAGSYPHSSIYLLQHLFNNWFLALDMGRLTAAAVLVAAALLALVLPLQSVLRGGDER
ncbi:MAG: sugar ABC transporter permease [Ruthenibacterium sp.]